MKISSVFVCRFPYNGKSWRKEKNIVKISLFGIISRQSEGGETIFGKKKDKFLLFPRMVVVGG